MGNAKIKHVQSLSMFQKPNMHENSKSRNETGIRSPQNTISGRQEMNRIGGDVRNNGLIESSSIRNNRQLLAPLNLHSEAPLRKKKRIKERKKPQNKKNKYSLNITMGKKQFKFTRRIYSQS